MFHFGVILAMLESRKLRNSSSMGLESMGGSWPFKTSFKDVKKTPAFQSYPGSSLFFKQWQQ